MVKLGNFQNRLREYEENSLRVRGKRMAGRYGNSRTTIRNLRVVKIDADHHLVLVEGAVPGPNGGLVMIRPTNKKD